MLGLEEVNQDIYIYIHINIHIYIHIYRYRDAYVIGKHQKEADACLKFESARSFFFRHAWMWAVLLDDS
jgi:hypothetical protein